MKEKRISVDPLGSYTGRADDPYEKPIQDAMICKSSPTKWLGCLMFRLFFAFVFFPCCNSSTYMALCFVRIQNTTNLFVK